jgi:hypothetical protein
MKDRETKNPNGVHFEDCLAVLPGVVLAGVAALTYLAFAIASLWQS